MTKDESDSGSIKHKLKTRGDGGRVDVKGLLKKMSYHFKQNMRSDFSSARGYKLRRRRMCPVWSAAPVAVTPRD